MQNEGAWEPIPLAIQREPRKRTAKQMLEDSQFEESQVSQLDPAFDVKPAPKKAKATTPTKAQAKPNSAATQAEVSTSKV